MSQTYAGNGHYVLEYCRLLAKDQNADEELTWDLSGFMFEVSLFESLYSSTMSGYIAVVDSFNINQLLPLYGNETIELSFYTAGSEQNPIVYFGKVYKISEKHRISDHSSGYIIKFCSEAAILSKRSFVQRGFRSSRHQIVTDIYNKYLSGASRKSLEAQTTKGVSTYTWGAVEPLEAISGMSRTCMGTDGTVGFLFYENNKEFRLQSLQSLYQQEPVAFYSNRPAGVYDDVKDRHVEQFNSIQDIKINEENSLLDRIMDGVHGSDNIYYDILNKSLTNKHYRKNESFDPAKSLGKIPDKKFIEDGEDIMVLSYASGNPEQYLWEVETMMKKIEAETFKAKMSVFGDTAIKAGDTINVTIPEWDQFEEMTSSFEGKVLISSIRHTITKTTYVQVFNIQKDSYEENS